MDSLLATYASSDEEDDHQPPQQPPPPPPTAKRTALFSSLPKPQSSSVFQSLPQPKKALTKPAILDDDDDVEDQIASKPTSKPSSSVFSALPPPKSRAPIQPIADFSSAGQNPKRVVQFKPPINPYSINSSQFDDEDEEEEEEERRRKKESESSAQAASAKSKLSLPSPKHSAALGASVGLGSGSGSGRRAIVETESVGSRVESDSDVGQNVAASHENYQSSGDQNGVNYESYAGYESYQSGIDPNAANYGSYGGYESYHPGADQNVEGGVPFQTGISGSDGSNYGSYDYAGYSGYEQYGNAVDGSETAVAATVPANAGTGLSGIPFNRKRGRNEVPTEIIEVKQDELMKNRPREDQVKSTGIAFGPSYQPVSTKGKPSKLLRRKHQIGSLYFDMKQKEMELSERRSRGFLTKAETHAKYGW